LIPKITTSADWQKPVDHAWINIVFAHAGLGRLGLQILYGFPLEFRVPMAKREQYLGDAGESDPLHWDYPFGTADLHAALIVMAPDRK
jgi:hypothetical protein